MKRVATLLIAALLFVGCEKKEEGGSKESAKTSTQASAQKIGSYDLTVVPAKGVTIQEGMMEGFDLMASTYRFNVTEGAEYTAKDLNSALDEAKSNTWDNLKGEELSSGYCMTYDMDSFGKSFEVRALIKKADKFFDIYGVAKNEKDQASIVAMVKSIK